MQEKEREPVKLCKLRRKKREKVDVRKRQKSIRVRTYTSMQERSADKSYDRGKTENNQQIFGCVNAG